MRFLRLRRIATVAAASVVLLALLTFAFLQTSTAKRYALEKVINALRDQGMVLNASGLDYGFFPPTVVLTEVRIRALDSTVEPDFLEADRVTISVRFLELLRRIVWIETADIEGMRLHVVVDEQGQTNLPETSRDAQAGQPNWRVGTVRISGNELLVEDRSRMLEVRLPEWRAELAGDPNGNPDRFSWSLDRPGEFTHDGARVPLDTILAEIQLSDSASTAAITNLRVVSGASEMRATGAIGSLREPQLDLTVDGNLLIEEFESLIHRTDLSGDLRLNATVRGVPSNPEIRGHVEGETLNLIRPLPPFRLQADAAYSLETRRLQVSTFSAQSTLLSATGDADVALGPDNGVSRANVTLQSVNLSVGAGLAGLPSGFDGRATGNVALNWPGLSFPNFSGNGQLRVRNVQVPEIQEELQGNLQLVARSGSLQIVTEDLASDSAGIRGTVSLAANRDLSGNVQIEVSELDEFLESSPVSGNAMAGVDIGGKLSDPELDIQARGENLSLTDIRDGEFTASAHYASRVLDISQASALWNNQSASVTGSIGFQDATPALNLSAEAHNADLRALLQAFPDLNVPASGTIDFTAQITGTPDNPTATMQLMGAGLQAYEEQWGDASADISVQDKKIQISRFMLTKGAGTIQVDGFIDLAAREFEMRAEGQNIEITQLTIPGVPAIRGMGSFQGDGRGSLDNPQASVMLRAEGVRIEDFVIGDLNATFDLEDRTVLFDTDSATRKALLSGFVRIDRPFETEFDLEVAELVLTDLPLPPETDISGKVSAKASGEGDLSRWKLMHVGVELAPLDLLWMDQRVTSIDPVRLEIVDGSLVARNAVLRSGQTTVDVSGSVPLTDTARAADLTVKADARLEEVLPQLQSLMPGESVYRDIGASGHLDVSGTVRGDLSELDIRADVAIDDSTMKVPRLPGEIEDLRLRASVSEGTIQVSELMGKWAEGSIEGRGSLPLKLVARSLPLTVSPTAPQTGRFAVDLSDARLDRIEDMPQNVAGQVSLHAEAELPSMDVRTWTADLSFPQFSLILGGRELRQSAPSSASLRDGRVTIGQLDLNGQETRFHVSGDVDLGEPVTANLMIEGNGDAAVLNSPGQAIQVGGEAQFQIGLRGPVNEPIVNGFANVQDGQVQLLNPRVALEGLNLRLEAANSLLTLTQLQGTLNGGLLEGGGTARISSAGLSDIQLRAQSEGVYMNFPEGVQTISNLNLTATGSTQELTVAGTVDVLEGSYQTPVTIERSLFQRLLGQSSPILRISGNQPDWLRLNVRVRTLSPLVVDTAFAQGEANANLQVLGTMADPGLVGRITVEDGATVTLQERKYALDRAIIDFTDETSIRPVIDAVAQTTASGYDITITVQGDATEELATTLASDPVLPESDIASILATGRTLSNVSASGADIAKEQLLAYLAGSYGGELTQQAGRAIGLSQLQIEPSLIASEAEPTARLTVGRQITSRLDLVYSMNLRNSSDQIWIADYDVTRHFSARALRQEDNSYRFQFQHDLLFGQSRVSAAAPSAPKKRVGTVEFSGSSHFSNEKLRDVAGLKTGKRYNFFEVQEAVNKIRKLYVNEELLEAQAIVRRTDVDSTVNLRIELIDGPHVELVFQGASLSKDFRNEVATQWQTVPLESLRVDMAVTLVRAELIRHGYLRPKIETAVIMETSDLKRIHFQIDPGVNYSVMGIAFEGITAVRRSELEAALEQADFRKDIWARGPEAAEAIRQHLANLGYLDATVERNEELNPDTRMARMIFSIKEGPLFRFSAIDFEGNQTFTASRLSTASTIAPGQPVEQTRIQEARAALQTFYRNEGFRDVRVNLSLQKSSEMPTVQTTFIIEENRRSVLREIQVSGNQWVSEPLIRAEIGLNTGDFVSPEKVARMRRNLNRTGAFSSVDLDVVPAENQSGVLDNEVAVNLTAAFKEVPSFELRYGGFFDNERGFGGIADFITHNVAGSARTAGVRTRYDADLREVRAYFSQPSLHRLPMNSVGSIFYRREFQTEPETEKKIVTDRKGVTGNAEYHLGEKNVVAGGFRFEWVHIYKRDGDVLNPADDVRSRLVPLTGSFTRDTRNDTFDATRGWFTSQTVAWTPPILGSQSRFMKYFGQVFNYKPFGEPTRVAWSGERRNRLVYVAGARVGFVGGLGGEPVVASERFQSGGSTTVRGFRENSLGPHDADGFATGGEALLILNNEFRFPVYKFFNGVGFLDAGNVYGRLEDFDPFDLRAGAGFGLRVRTPWATIRMDYGFNLNSRPGEPLRRFYFSIGQAF